ncbi:hypothetical protein F511_04379 [Dorcoceras hygrometricum]|uniref:Isoflavone 2'-hydroxylase-like n=1 Tax=Dorcoceras hygrometricum TaxID=472368 RepID=A0A2Z7BL72_9LAMI|nr:hypothetical protein F511_04379 [Dorcoceras hygrometricum]
MLSQIRADETLNLVRKLLHVTGEEPDRIVEVKPALFEYMYNVLTRMIMGKRYYGKSVKDSEEVNLLEEIATEISNLAFETNVIDYLPFMRWFGFQNVEKRLASVNEKRDSFMQRVLDEQRGMMGNHDPCLDDAATVRKKRSMVEVLLDLQRSEPKYYTDETIKSLLLVLLQGGSSTSAIALEWAFSLLLDNPQVLKKAQSEIDAHVGTDRLITESDVAALPYLRRIILETFRLHPPVSIIMPHRSSTACTVGGYRIPAGTILLVNTWEIHNNPKTWADPEKFRPDRFLGLDCKKHLGFRIVPFGWGRRACPGEKLAISSIGLGLGSLIQCFDWKTVGKIDMSEGLGVTTPKVQPLLAKCTPRPFVKKIVH